MGVFCVGLIVVIWFVGFGVLGVVSVRFGIVVLVLLKVMKVIDLFIC